MKAILSKLLSAADLHGEDAGDVGHTIGDLQSLLQQSWQIMTIAQRLRLLQSDTVKELTLTGGQGAFDVEDLVKELNLEVVLMEMKVTSSGYEIRSNTVDGTFFWESESSDVSEDFYDRDDAIEAAFTHMTAQ